MTELLDHSPLGASGMYRWSECPGSVGLSRGITSTSSSYAQEGTDAHEVASRCLMTNEDAWRLIGFTIGKTKVTKDMADAVQEYLDAVRFRHPDRNQGNSWIERSFHCGGIHELMYGTADLTVYNQGQRALDAWDYKHGAGIVIDVQENPQLMYYGVGMLEDLDLWGKVDKVTLHIAQPRGWHQDGAIRSWSISTEALDIWMATVLVPAMNKAQTSTELKSGDHCRFCPARKRACPQLAQDMDDLEIMMDDIAERGGAEELSNEQIGRFLDLFAKAKIVEKASSEVAYHRLQAGEAVEGYKLVKSRTNRAWADEAEDALVDEFGDRAYVALKLKSPAQIAKLPKGKALSDELSFKPEGSLTVANDSDKRAAVNVNVSDLFTPVEEK